jgi:hypothetical protein
MVLSVAVIVQQHLNGRLLLGESPAAFFSGEILPLPLGRTIPKQGAASFAALWLGAFPSDSGICMKSAAVTCERQRMMELGHKSYVHV